MPFLKRKIKSKMIVGFGLVFILVLLVQFFSNRSITALMEDEKALLKASKTVEKVEKVGVFA